MEFYDLNRTPAIFRANAEAKEAQSFQDLASSNVWQTAASRWGTGQLYACRVICPRPTRFLTILTREFEAAKEKARRNELSPVIQQLLRGPAEGPAALSRMTEILIIHTYAKESMGHVWASLAPLIERNTQPGDHDRPRRRLLPPPGRQPSSTPTTNIPPVSTPSTEASYPSSVGYVEEDVAPLLEDVTVRFASEFVRCILNHAQKPTRKCSVHWRVQRMKHIVAAPKWTAIDDGGIQVADRNNRVYQVALLEAKRAFQPIQDGRPTVSDELLGQIVGEALALRLSENSLFGDEIFVVIAIKHYLKFLHLNISQQFLASFRTMDPAASANPGHYLNVNSTEWLNAATQEGRRNIVCHTIALVSKADTIVWDGDPIEDDL
ncbi:hypothetical protein CCMA1212_004377 [Trichoderma ghanense]|uniref:Uncharacterized protein n=1 Tax=Trichoderma ghanense TaxID=65468 RepID=A0ABY2H5G8_9HYPO